MAQRDYGGKPAPNWKQEIGFDFVGYPNAILRATDPSSGQDFDIGFLMGPTDFDISFTNNLRVVKTNSSWAISNGARIPGTLSLRGFLVDSDGTPERLNFISRYQLFFEEDSTSDGNVISRYNQSVIIEGVTYKGKVETFSYSKSGNVPFLYQLNLTFSFNDYIISSFQLGDSVKKIIGLPFSKSISDENFDLGADFEKAMNIIDTTYIGDLDIYFTTVGTRGEIINRNKAKYIEQQNKQKELDKNKPVKNSFYDE